MDHATPGKQPGFDALVDLLPEMAIVLRTIFTWQLDNSDLATDNTNRDRASER